MKYCDNISDDQNIGKNDQNTGGLSVSDSIYDVFDENINNLKQEIEELHNKFFLTLGVDDVLDFGIHINDIFQFIEENIFLKNYLELKYGKSYIQKIYHVKNFLDEDYQYNLDELKKYFNKEIKVPLDFLSN